MKTSTLILNSLKYHWRMNVAVALGVATATAVITGALVVGDSVRGSLTHLMIERLGSIDQALVAPRFFRAELASEVAADPKFTDYFRAAVPAIVLEAACEDPESKRRASEVTVVGYDAEFWSLGNWSYVSSDTSGAESSSKDVIPTATPAGLILNQTLAAALNVRAGQDVIVRLGRPADVPADSPLGRKSETTRSLRLPVAGVIAAEGVGRFGLRPSQREPLNAYVPLAELQRVLDQASLVNAVFVAGEDADQAAPDAADGVLSGALKPTLADYGLQLADSPEGYWQLTSQSMLLPPAVEQAVEKAAEGETNSEKPQGLLTYLANTIAAGGKEIPYSTITAVDFVTDPPLGPFTSPDGKPLPPLKDDEIALNSWAAEQLGIDPQGSFTPDTAPRVSVTYFEPESTHGTIREQTKEFWLAAIVALDGLAADRNLTPTVKGVTDKGSIADWNPPFPFRAERIRPADDDYWHDYGATPKAFVSLSTGQKLWQSRFGGLTAVRWPKSPALNNADAVIARLQLKPEEFGLQFLPLKRLGLAASSGTTPFEGLFVGFSMFLIASAVLLIVLLFRLGLDGRASQVGIMLASGLSGGLVRRLLSREGLMVSILGAIVGAAIGVLYAALMLWGLRTIWLGAISAPFLELHVTPRAIAIGWIVGTLVAWLAIGWTLRRLRRVAPRQLLAGRAEESASVSRRSSRRKIWIAIALIFVALIAGSAATRLEAEAQAGAFFAAGAAVLAACLVAMSVWLRREGSVAIVATGRWRIERLAFRNAARSAGRTLLAMGLMAAAVFLIVAISVFRLSDVNDADRRDSGLGGYKIWAQSDLPLHYNLATAEGQNDLGFQPKQIDVLGQAKIFPLRLRAGEDASCLNLYQPRQPQVLGVSEEFIERGGFAWGSTAAKDAAEAANPWRLLHRAATTDTDGVRRVPMVLDQNTSQYSLHLSGVGDVLEMRDDAGSLVRFEVVGLLKNSLFQGVLLISEPAFLQLFPQTTGDRVFLIDTLDEQIDATTAVLESGLVDFGLDAERTGERLAGFAQVQNTYLSTFQALGALGLLLGTLGLIVIELRNVFERRGELALLRAVGFRNASLVALVAWENVAVLLGGLLIGLVAALVAVLPQAIGRDSGIPWLTLALMLGVILVAALVSGSIAARAALRAPLLPALRGE